MLTVPARAPRPTLSVARSWMALASAAASATRQPDDVELELQIAVQPVHRVSVEVG